MKQQILTCSPVYIFLIFFIIKSTFGNQEPYFFETAHSIAMGSAHTAFPGDANALSYNPAGLADIHCKTISLNGFMQQYSWTSITKFYSIGSSLCYTQSHFGISLFHIEAGDPKELKYSDLKGEPVRSGEKWFFAEQCLLIGYGRKIFDRLAAGLSIKYHRSDSDSRYIKSNILKEQHGLSLDIGFLYNMKKNVSFGLVAKNIIHSKFDYVILDYFTNVAFVSELPKILNLGIIYKPIKKITIAFDAHNILEDEIQDHNRNVGYRFKRSFHLGSEYEFIQRLFFRFGFMIEKLPISFPTKINTPFKFVNQFTFTSGMGLNTNHIFLNLAIDFDPRKNELEKYHLSISGNTFRYMISMGWFF